MIIRRVVREDFPQLLGLIKLFEAEEMGEYGLKVDDTYTLASMGSFIDTSLVMEHEGKIVGVMAGVVAKSPLCEEPIFQQAFWFLLKEYRSHSVELLEALEGFAKNVLKVDKIVLCSHGDKSKEVKDRFFRRRGYALLETHYLKNIGE